MKLGKFLCGVAAGIAVSYLVVKGTETKYVKPERVIQQIKNKMKDNMNIVGSWIHVEPVIEELNGVKYNVYQGGLTALQNGMPHLIDFKVDADTGTILSWQS